MTEMQCAHLLRQALLNIVPVHGWQLALYSLNYQKQPSCTMCRSNDSNNNSLKAQPQIEFDPTNPSM